MVDEDRLGVEILREGGSLTAYAQSAVDERNRVFWNELCGTDLAQSIGITEITPSSLACFDEAYLAKYPYLTRYLDELPVEGREVLEIGLGFGTVGQILAARGGRYHGVDIAAGPVAMLRDRLRWVDRPDEGGVIQASALELPWADGKFDVVVSIGCLHHTGDLPRAVDEVRRVLVPGGLAFVMLYNAHSFRRLALAPRARLRAFLAGLDAAERVRAMYDVDTTGAAAPHTDYVSRREARRLFGSFSDVSIETQNFEALTVPFTRGRVTIPRDRLLDNVGRVLGLDLYVRARK